MKKNFYDLLIFVFIILSIYFVSSCNVEKVITPLTSGDMGILRTNEAGEILGGDYSDWCIRQAADTFTYVVSFTIGYTYNNKIAILRWTTSKEFNNYGFEIERKRFNESYIKIGFIPGQGTVHDSTRYMYSDTVQYYAQNYSYRLKMIDIYGNYKYYYQGPISVNPPLTYSYGPVYPNPTKGFFTLPFSLPRKDTVTIYFIDNADTIYLAFRRVYNAGNYKINYSYDTTKYHNSQNRLYFFSGSLQPNEVCKNYGDIEFK